MHWAVRSKKDLMLEGADQTSTNTVQNKEWDEQRETKKGEPGSTPEGMKPKAPGSPEAISPQNSGSPGKLCHLAFHKGRLEIRSRGYITAILNLFWCAQQCRPKNWFSILNNHFRQHLISYVD